MGSSPSTPAKKPIAVVLGGGPAGLTAARTLDATGNFFVVLVDRKNYMLHNIGALRAALDTTIAKQILVPYNNLLKHGIVLQADIEEVRHDEVRLRGRPDGLRFDYLVIATGSSYAFPGKVAEANLLDAYLRYEAFGQRVRQPNVKNIVIVGGGSVGIELAGELKEYLPHVTVTLVHSNARLIHNEPLKEEFLAGVTRQLAALDVRLELEQRVAYPQQVGPEVEVTGHGGAFWNIGQVTTSKGKVLPADLLLFTAGAKNNTKSLVAHFGDVMRDERLIVNAHMQVQGHERIFAAGDIAGTACKRAMYASAQGEIVAKNIIALAKNAAKAVPAATTSLKLASFAPFAGHPLVLTIGSKGGQTQFFNAGESVFGAKVSSMLKSKSLFIDRSWADLNQKAALAALKKQQASVHPSPPAPFDVDAAKHQKQIGEAIRALSLTPEETKAALKFGFPVAAAEHDQQFV